MTIRFSILLGMIVFASVSRLIPHPWNMTPIISIALFGGARFAKTRQASLIVFSSLFLSDLMIGLYPMMPVVYIGFAVVLLVGARLRDRQEWAPIGFSVLLSSFLFYLITNFGVWAFSGLYPKTIDGLFQSYVMGLPYFRNTLMGNLFYSLVLFGGFHLAELRFKVLRRSLI